MYRLGNSKCAAGCLIGDDEYNEALMEHRDWRSLLSRKLVPRTHFDLILELQQIHDHCLPPTWREQLKCLAKRLNFQFNPPS